METILGTFSEFHVGSEIVTGDDDDGRASSEEHITDNKLPSSVCTVMSNTDLLLEILLRLPVISLLMFKSVSKQWLSLITSPNFTLRRSLIPNIDLPSGLFYRFPFQPDYLYDLIRLDIRIPTTSSRFETNLEGSNAYILQACNGLLLCYARPDKYYVYNPSIKLFKMLPQCNDLNLEPSQIAGHIKMAFDPTKSPHYKVVHATIIGDEHFVSSIKIHTYSSQTRNWSCSLVCSDPMPTRPFLHFDNGIYWNDGIHWLTHFVTECSHYKLYIVNERPVLTTLQLPVNLDDMYTWNREFFETRGCLLLLGMDGTHSQRLNIYEMRYGYSEWSFKYFVNLNDIIMPFPETWFIASGVGCIALGEREEDSFIHLLVAFCSLHLLLVCDYAFYSRYDPCILCHSHVTTCYSYFVEC